jgi:uncharacterized protein (TIGR03083 family)
MATILDHSDVDHVELFAHERRTLLGLLADLDDADWSRPTPCPGWSVLDLACHLVGDDLGLLARHRDGHVGLHPPGDADDAAFAEWLDALQDQWVRAARRLSRQVTVALLAWAEPQLVEMLRAQDASARTAVVTWAGSEPVPRWLDQARELSEYWIHRQQLHLALDRPPDLAGPTAAAVIDALRWAYPYRLASAPRPEGDTVAITITGELDRQWYLRADRSGWEFAPTPGPRLVAQLRTSADEAWRLLTNNLSRDDQRQLDLTGDDAVVEVLRRTRAIIAAPNASVE